VRPKLYKMVRPRWYLNEAIIRAVGPYAAVVVGLALLVKVLNALAPVMPYIVASVVLTGGTKLWLRHKRRL